MSLDGETPPNPASIHRRVVITLCAVIVLVSGFAFIGMPLLPEHNDSAWYYMNVHWALYGTYLWEEAYPGWKDPSLFYPMGGYSGMLLGAKGVEELMGIHWSYVVRFLQFAGFLIGAWCVSDILVHLGLPRTGTIAGLLCAVYVPLFRVSGYVMSESFSAFLLVLQLWLLVRGVRQRRLWMVCLACLTAGYSMLYRPVFALVLGVEVIVLVGYARKWRRYRILAPCLILMAACPLGQVVFNGVQFGQYVMRAGSGWNIYNRVIAYDGTIPSESPTLQRVREELSAKGESFVVYALWWDVARQLSRCGYTPRETQEICKAIALDGVREQPLRYVTQTFRMWIKLLYHPMPILLVPQNYKLCWHHLYLFGKIEGASQRNLLLAVDLMQQRKFYGDEWLGNASLILYAKLGKLFETIERIGFQKVVAVGYVIWLGLCTVTLIRRRDAESALIMLIASAPALIMFGTCLAERLAWRYRLPAQPLMLLGACAGFGWVAKTCIVRLRTYIPGVRRRKDVAGSRKGD